MDKFKFRQLKYAFTLIITGVLLSGCQINSEPKNEFEQVRERGVLRVGTLNNQFSYYIGPHGPTGLDYELAREFADELGVELEIKPAYRQADLFPALEKGEIDLIATGLSQTPELTARFRPAPAYYYVSQQVVYKKGQYRPRDIEDLIDQQTNATKEEGSDPVELKIIAKSPFVPSLTQAQQEFPELQFDVIDNADSRDLLKQVSKGTLNFTVADSIEISLTQRLFPDLALAFELTEDQPVSWYTRRSEDESLYAMLIEFFGDIKQSGHLATLEEKYIGHIGAFDYVDTRAFIRALDSKLPRWAPLFQKYSKEFDWRLIAAVSYQESHWNPRAKSPTGVRGMMMLTLPTAKSVGVTNRLDAEQSIRGGAEYLRRIVNRVPDSITEHERIWFALASYNVGYGHVMDARRLTKSQGANPDSWSDVKERLPLLRKKAYYSKTRYGYARGDEALNYVENIRRYYQTILGHVNEQSFLKEDEQIDDIQIIPPLDLEWFETEDMPENSEESDENTETMKQEASSKKDK